MHVVIWGYNFSSNYSYVQTHILSTTAVHVATAIEFLAEVGVQWHCGYTYIACCGTLQVAHCVYVRHVQLMNRVEAWLVASSAHDVSLKPSCL